MKKRIDLYLPEFKPRIELLNLNFVLVIWVLILVLLSVVYLSQQGKQNVAAQQAKQSSNFYAQKKLFISQLSVELENRKKDQGLLSQLDNIQGEIRDKKAILLELSGREKLKQKGFSALMADLAASHEGGLWLKRINVEQQQLRIEGAVSSAGALPLWLISCAVQIISRDNNSIMPDCTEMKGSSLTLY